MDENSYNLIDEKWIPVLMQDGTPRNVSLEEVFSDTRGLIKDLALIPYERIAVIRLLLCIAHAALGTGRVADRPALIRLSIDEISQAACAYLQKWHSRFFLYGPGAFMQPDALESIGDSSRDKLVFHLSSGSNSTLYDHEAGMGTRHLSSGQTARSMLAFQLFSAGGRSTICKWNGVETSASVKAGPFREKSMLATIVLGESLLETVKSNLLTDKQVESNGVSLGGAIWEMSLDDRHELESRQVTLTWCGRLVPLARLIKLDRSSNSIILGEALQYAPLPDYREPMATVVEKSKSKDVADRYTYISVDPAKMPWRDLSSVLAVKSVTHRGNSKAPLVLANLRLSRPFKIWTGGLMADQAKDVECVEWMVTVESEFLEEGRIEVYKQAIEVADSLVGLLRNATNRYADVVNIDKADVFRSPAQRMFWDILAEARYQKFLFSDDYDPETWRGYVRDVARTAYDQVCPRSSARQIQAYTLGLFEFSPKKKGKK